jgi:ribose-phosphate pyrophosphokinase
MRQDIAFTPGEVVSQRHLGGCWRSLFDCVITIDPHLHRMRRWTRSAAPLPGASQWPADSLPLLVGPDEEADQWVRAAGERTGLKGLRPRCGDHR